MQSDQKAKQQVVDRIKGSTNILVTVGHDPSVDALTAALGLTLILNKLDKHATAVFSGAIPPAITFLKPSATFESTVDSLRDFIIALDKEKADRLRYKVEGGVVRVFITPYRTVITEKDLTFSLGDFNVELIIALGVGRQEDLDTAITAHGRILHDAAVVTINAGEQTSDLGSVNWHDERASSLSEMMVTLGDSLDDSSIDEQIATALLTGIVAATDRFSNTKTAPRVMTMAAQLMAAGANQQLIAAKLQEGHEVSAPAPARSIAPADAKPAVAPAPVAPAPVADGEMQITHTAAHATADHAPKASHDGALASALASAHPAAPTLSVADLHADLEAASHEIREAVEESDDRKIGEYVQTPLRAATSSDWRTRPPLVPPMTGGTLNATTSEAEEDARQREADERNRIILTHGGSSSSTAAPLPNLPSFTDQSIHDKPVSLSAPEPVLPPSAQLAPLPAPEASLPPLPPPPMPLPAESPELPALPPVDNPVEKPVEPPVFAPERPHVPTLAEIEQQAKASHEHESTNQSTTPDVDSARAAVDAALGGVLTQAHDSGMPGFEITGGVPAPDAAPMLPPVPATQPDTSSLPPLPPPPTPDFTLLPPPLPPAPTGSADLGVPLPPAAEGQPAPTPPASNDPGQYRIPGQ